MAYIYKITNDVNGKVYIGQTSLSVNARFKQHLKDYNKRNSEIRPLYFAMKKYGIEHFHVETIEETDQPLEREKYWIKYYNSYNSKEGYNATIGGDGRGTYIDEGAVVREYLKLQNQKDVAKKFKISRERVSLILRKNNIEILTSAESSRHKNGKIVGQYSLDGKFIQSFPSVKEAIRSLGKNADNSVSNITRCCKGKRKTAYGYMWKFVGTVS